MTLEEWFDKYFAPEYVNVQDKETWKAQARTELEEILQPKPVEEPTGG